MDQITTTLPKHRSNGDSFKKETPRTLPFPVIVFPEFHKNLITNVSESLGFEKGYCATALLSVVSVCIGNAITVKVKNSWIEPCILYCALYGDSSKKKTPIIKTFSNPLYELEAEYQAEYEDQLKTWEQFDDNPKKPKRKHIIIKDATPESISDIHSTNKKSLLYENDELVSMVKRFNQYRTGPDQEFWLSQWSNIPVKITRKSQDTIYIQNPFITILGGIQPSVIKELAKDGRDENGFLYRILFTMPENTEVEQWSEAEADPGMLAGYKKNILELHKTFDESFSENGQIEIEFSHDAKESFITWFNQNCDLINVADDFLKSIYRKLEAYFIRFSLILEVLDCSQTGRAVESISKDSVFGAMRLIEYFRWTSDIIYEKIKNEGFRSELDQKIFNELPIEFKTNDIIEIAQCYGLSRSAVENRLIRRLKEKGFIRKVRHGIYTRGVDSVEFVEDTKSETTQTLHTIQG